MSSRRFASDFIPMTTALTVELESLRVSIGSPEQVLKTTTETWRDRREFAPQRRL